MQTFIERYIEQGMQQGMQQGKAAVVLRLIERRFGPLSDDVRKRVTQADPNTGCCNGPSASSMPTVSRKSFTDARFLVSSRLQPR